MNGSLVFWDTLQGHQYRFPLWLPKQLSLNLPYFIVSTRYFLEYWLFLGRLISVLIFECVWKQHSSEKIKFFYFSGAIAKYAWHHFFLFLLCWTDRNGFRYAILPNTSPLRRYLLIVHTETFWSMSDVVAISVAVKKG